MLAVLVRVQRSWGVVEEVVMSIIFLLMVSVLFALAITWVIKKLGSYLARFVENRFIWGMGSVICIFIIISSAVVMKNPTIMHFLLLLGLALVGFVLIVVSTVIQRALFVTEERD